MSVVLENLRRDARMRMESDSYMSAAWVIVPLLPIVGGVVLFVLFLYAIFSSLPLLTNSTTTTTTTVNPAIGITFLGLTIAVEIGFFVVGIIWVFLVYKLVRRRNTHFARQRFLYEDLVNTAKGLAAKKGVDLSLPLNNLERTYREAVVEETEKSAAMWAILAFITGIAGLYVFYFLMKDFFKHERKEELFLDDLNRALVATGTTMNLPRRTVPIPDRSFALYFILSLITGGIFAVYWVYVLIEDPNNHFRQQAMIEDTILSQVTPLLQ
jgi:uncharacterized membrane protein (DUF373 family)